ncbi:MAG: sporulation protein YqfD [Paenisporosarcina sp.]
MSKKILQKRFIVCHVKKGPNVFTFLQALREQEVDIIKLSSTEDKIKFSFHEHHLKKIRIMRKKYGITLKMNRPDTENIIQFQPYIWIGLMLFILFPYLCSHVMWEVGIQDVSEERKAKIHSELLKLNVKERTLKKSIPSDGDIRQTILAKNKDLSWIHIKRKGSSIQLEAVPAPINEIKYSTKQTASDLIATRKGVITYYDLESGERVVQIHDTVKKGDLLASGIIKQGNIEKIVGAEGKVYADYWMEVSFELPKTIQYRELSGKEVTFFQVKPAWKAYNEKRSLQSFIQFFSDVFKINHHLIYENKTQIVDEEWIQNSFIPLLQIKSNTSLSSTGQIKQEKILHMTWTNDKVNGKVLYYINDNIAQKRPIHQGD